MTPAEIASLKPKQTLWDSGMGGVPGLHVRSRGRKDGLAHKSFYFYYRVKSTGAHRRPKVGDVGILTLSQARDLARKWKAEVQLGGDPVRDAKPINSPLVKAVFERAWATYWNASKSARSGWAGEVKRLFEREIAPAFGNKSIACVHRKDVLDWHRRYADKPYTGNRALSVLKKLFALAEEDEVISGNPCRGVKNHPENSRKRFATAEELARLGAILSRDQKRKPRQVAFIRALLLTGARPKSLEQATWSQLKDGVLTFEGKTGVETVVFPPELLALIGTPWCQDSPIFRMKAPRGYWNRIRKEAGCPDLWLRDSRRTFATVGFSAGHGMDQISQALNHKSAQTTRIYAKLTDVAKKEVVEDTARLVSQLLRPISSPGDP